jgi:hypothetical protein
MRFTAKFVNQPRDQVNGKFGNIKTTEDRIIMVPVGMLNHYVRGGTYDMPVEETTWGKGDDAKPVIVAHGMPQLVGQVGPNAMNVAYYPPPPGGYAGQQAQGSPPGGFPPSDNVGRANPPPPPAASPAPPRGNPEARSIFATGVVGRALGSGKFTASEIDVLLQGALEAYDRRLGGG